MRWFRFMIMPLCAAAVAAAGSAVAANPAVLEAQRQRVEVLERISPSVVSIFAAGGHGGGSGVLVSADGYALTNYHVVSSAGSFMKCGLNDGKLYDAVIVGIDPTGDVALIKLLGRDDFPAAVPGDSDQVRVGDWVYAIGNPFLLATDFQPTVTYGMVSGVHRYQYPAGTFLEYTDCIQVDASINPGNSGGPLFNAAGDLIGINGRASFDKRGRVNSGAGYAISINQCLHFLDHLKSGRIVDHASLGATVTSDGGDTVVVEDILERSDAYRRGLRRDDEILSFAGQPIRSVNQFKNILGIYPEGWAVPVEFRRGDDRQLVYVRLAGLHRDSEMLPGGNSRPEPQPKTPDGKQPRPQPDPQTRPVEQSSAAPDEYKHMYVEKEGFTNYYFNALHQRRVLNALDEWGDFAAVAGTWTLAGRTGDDREFEFTLTDRGLGLEVGREAYFQPLDGSPLQDEPPGSGGLLTALHHWRLLMTAGPRVYSEFYYEGSEPIDGSGAKADVLISELAGVRTRWYFDRESGRFIGFDAQRAEDVDDCRVRFNELAAWDGRKLPREFTVRRGDQPFEVFRLERVELGRGSAKGEER